jgi:hypothetical protein
MSLSVIVPMPLLSLIVAPPVAPERFRENCSSSSGEVLLTVATVTVLLVSAAAKVSVPEVAT